MKIAILSSWGIRCGLADYAADLARAWQHQGHEVKPFTERSLDGSDDPSDLPPAERYFLRTFYNAKEVVEPILEWNPDVVSIEHEFGIWPNDLEFVKIVRQLHTYTNVAVTLHTVPRYPLHRWFFQSLPASKSCVLIVHHPGALAMGEMFDQLFQHVPHGLGAFQWERQAPNPRSQVVKVLMPGFISASKGHLEVVDAANYSDGWDLEICGHPDSAYLDLLVEKIRYMGLEQRVTVTPQYLERMDLRQRLALADVVILNTVGDNFSASGQAADCISFGAKTLSKAMPIYDDLYGIGFKFGYPTMLTHGAPTRDEIGRTVLAAAKAGLSKTQVETMRQMCKLRSWDVVAMERLRLLGLA